MINIFQKLRLIATPNQQNRFCGRLVLPTRKFPFDSGEGLKKSKSLFLEIPLLGMTLEELHGVPQKVKNLPVAASGYLENESR